MMAIAASCEIRLDETVGKSWWRLYSVPVVSPKSADDGKDCTVSHTNEQGFWLFCWWCEHLRCIARRMWQCPNAVLVDVLHKFHWWLQMNVLTATADAVRASDGWWWAADWIRSSHNHPSATATKLLAIKPLAGLYPSNVSKFSQAWQWIVAVKKAHLQVWFYLTGPVFWIHRSNCQHNPSKRS